MQTYHGYKIQNMLYLDGSTIRPSRSKRKKQKIKNKGLFFSGSKPFAVSSESFQYEHGSQYGESNYKNYKNRGVSTLKRASIGTDTRYNVNKVEFSPMQNTIKSKAGRKYINSLNDSQFRFLYGSPRESFSYSQRSSINPSYSDNLEDNYFETDYTNWDYSTMASSSPKGKMRVYSIPPILVSSGPFVRYDAPEATNLHMIYTDDDYSKICQREHQLIPFEQFLTHEPRSNPHQENQPRERKLPQSYPKQHLQPKRHYSATGSYATNVQFISPSGKLVSYRVIRPKVTGAPVSVMVE